MKKLLWSLGALLLFVSAEAQKKAKPQTYAATITSNELKDHLYVVASAEMAGRNTPSPELEKAGDYIEEHFRSLGLKPGNGNSFRQYYPLYRDSVTSSEMKLNGRKLDLNKDFQPSASNYSAEMRFSEVVFVGHGIVDSSRNDYEGLQVAGKLVMILDGSPEGYTSNVRGFRSPAGTYGKLNAAMQQGVAGILMVDDNFPRRSFNAVSNWSMNNYRSTQPPASFAISEEVAAAILGVNSTEFSKMKNTGGEKGIHEAKLDLAFTKTTVESRASNVLGLLEGTDLKDEYIVITAHYDHVGQRNDTTIFYGADDDGSGTVTILELAEAFAAAKAKGYGPRRSILFMTVSGEEKGLWGSAYYADNPVYPLEKTTVNLNIDMIGRIGSEYQEHKDSANYVYIIGDDKLSSDLEPITDMVNKKYMKMHLDRKYNDPNDRNRFYYRSDHYNFAEKGVPVIFYFNGTHKDYHQPTDTPDKINYKLLAKRAQLVFYTAWEMAMRDEMLKRDKPLGMASRN